MSIENEDFVVCKLCEDYLGIEYRKRNLIQHLLRVHKGLTFSKYQLLYPESICRSFLDRRAIGLKHKGKVLSMEHRGKLVISHLGQKAWNKGKKATPKQLRALCLGSKVRVKDRFTYPHKMLVSYLEEMNFINGKDFVVEYTVKTESTYRHLDVAFPKRRIDIEVDGSYWHDVIEDAIRDVELRKIGWKTFRFCSRVLRRRYEGETKAKLSQILVKHFHG